MIMFKTKYDKTPEFDLDELDGNKPVFDGRMQYFKVLGAYMGKMSDCIILNDYQGWIKTLKALLMMIAPYIEESQRKEINVLIVKAISNLRGVNPRLPGSIQSDYLQRHVEDVLFEAGGKLHLYGSHVLLPTNDSDEDDEFDAYKAVNG